MLWIWCNSLSWVIYKISNCCFWKFIKEFPFIQKLVNHVCKLVRSKHVQSAWPAIRQRISISIWTCHVNSIWSPLIRQLLKKWFRFASITYEQDFSIHLFLPHLLNRISYIISIHDLRVLNFEKPNPWMPCQIHNNIRVFITQQFLFNLNPILIIPSKQVNERNFV